jgi:hypothetical protein
MALDGASVGDLTMADGPNLIRENGYHRDGFAGFEIVVEDVGRQDDAIKFLNFPHRFLSHLVDKPSRNVDYHHRYQ